MNKLSVINLEFEGEKKRGKISKKVKTSSTLD